MPIALKVVPILHIFGGQEWTNQNGCSSEMYFSPNQSRKKEDRSNKGCQLQDGVVSVAGVPAEFFLKQTENTVNADTLGRTAVPGET